MSLLKKKKGQIVIFDMIQEGRVWEKKKSLDAFSCCEMFKTANAKGGKNFKQSVGDKRKRVPDRN